MGTQLVAVSAKARKWAMMGSRDGKHFMLRFMITLVMGLVASVDRVTVAFAQTYPQLSPDPKSLSAGRLPRNFSEEG